MSEENIEEKKEEVVKVEEVKKEKDAGEALKEAGKEVVSSVITQLILALFAALGTLLEKVKIKKEGETRWWMIVLYAVIIIVLGGGITFGTKYYAEISQWIVNLFGF